eukprot:TRINITY_DN330_c0_g4_i1.p1 TRINITY_DN330_c0_g4~~TRINITY_DN330_c0_g4_i1.p1  ORF type:complete len:1568 (-),score=424.95 TRINITY_DN330_c0_g4_i1:36-4208(-)
MASLLETDATGLNELALQYKTIHTIASRCGVFAKADVQPLLSEGARKEDVAMSIFQAVVNQTIAGLACGKQITGQVTFLGGPLHFLSGLRQCFVETLHLAPENVVPAPHAHAMVCCGAALHGRKRAPMPLQFLERRLERLAASPDAGAATVSRLQPLFANDEEIAAFRKRHASHTVPRAELAAAAGPLFLGIDSGSTTNKLVLIDDSGRLLDCFYACHQGKNLRNAVDAVIDLLKRVDATPGTFIAGSGVTGYGEGLLQAALRADVGVVETVAHLRAARFFQPDADFVLDIGGQDMKSMRIGSDGVISSICLNEACSSGCGSFIQTLTTSLGISLTEFAQAGLVSKAPIDLGMKCTVFMNSRIKAAQKDGVSVEDMSAGIALSVIRNALFKVIRLSSVDNMGQHVVVQGGTFLNDSVLRALELILKREVIRPDIAGHMGAFGAALEARDMWQARRGAAAAVAVDSRVPSPDSTPPATEEQSGMLSLAELTALEWDSAARRCGKCTNNCLLSVHTFKRGSGAGAGEHIAGNRCERGLGDAAREAVSQIPNMFEWQRKRVFTYRPLPTAEATRGKIGFPRALNFFDEFPLWEAVFSALKFQVILSNESSDRVFNEGMDTIPIESECFPVKMLHGHIANLTQSLHVPVVFFPSVPFRTREDSNVTFQYRYGSHPVYYTCSLISGYHNVLRHMPLHGAKLLHPVVPLFDPKSASVKLHEALVEVFADITPAEVAAAMRLGYTALARYRAEVRAKGEEVLRTMEEKKMGGFVVACRPYHLDPFFSASIPNLLTCAGYAVLTADAVEHIGRPVNIPQKFINMTLFDARILNAAKAVCVRQDLALVHLVSFGCSISPETDEEIHVMMTLYNKPHCCIKLDQNTNLGAVRVRIRSQVAAVDRQRAALVGRPSPPPPPMPVFKPIGSSANKVPRNKKLLIMNFSEEHAIYYAMGFNTAGYDCHTCPDFNVAQYSEVALRYVHPDCCLGVTLIIGMWLCALATPEFPPDKTDVMWIHMGGSCTAPRMPWFARDAFDKAGYTKVTIHSLDCSATTNPGFTLGQSLRINMGLTYGDALSQCVQRTRPYERVPGSVNKLRDEWFQRISEHVKHGKILRFSRLLHQLVHDFDTIPLRTEEHDKPRVGLVGIMCKGDPVTYKWILNFFEEEGCEVTPFIFTQYSECAGYYNIINNRSLAPDRAKWFGGKAATFVIGRFRAPLVDAFNNSRRFYHIHPIEEYEKEALKYLDTCHQSGEGWITLAQLLHCLNNGINNIVLMTPFMCLPIHVTGEGILQAIRKDYPQMNICVLTFDSSATFTNQLNRMKLMLGVMKDKAKAPAQLPPLCKLSDIEDLLAAKKDGEAPAPGGCTACGGSCSVAAGAGSDGCPVISGKQQEAEQAAAAVV